MNDQIGLQLYGPCDEEHGIIPELGDTVAIIMKDGRVRLLTISGAGTSPDGSVLYASGGEKLLVTDCYLLYTTAETSVE